MKPPFASLTAEWHNAPYPAISPTLPAHNHSGQTVVITGGGSGIGQATALAYATASAQRIILIGRRADKLEETKAQIVKQSPDMDVEIYPASVTRAGELRAVAESVRGWDVLILSAGRLMSPKSIKDSDPDEWWDVTEVGNARHELHLFKAS